VRATQRLARFDALLGRTYTPATLAGERLGHNAESAWTPR